VFPKFRAQKYSKFHFRRSLYIVLGWQAYYDADFAGSQFPDEEGGDDSRNVGLFTIKLFNIADSPSTCYPV
jgi:hypothetical protein